MSMSKPFQLARFIPFALVLLAIAEPAEGAPPQLFARNDPARAKIRAALPLLFSARPAADGSGRWLAPSTATPVLLRLSVPPSDEALRSLRYAGATLSLRDDGSPRGDGHLIAARLSAAALPRVAALDWVEQIVPDGPAVPMPRPLAGTAREIDAHHTWRSYDAAGVPLTGRGMTVCDVDRGIDVFHPLFFHADGGYLRWVDVDGDSAFSAGVDGVDLRGDGTIVVLRVLNSSITSYFGELPWFGSDDPSLGVGVDWLYADEDGSGTRDFGRDAGYDDGAPSFGEPLYAVDDVNSNGILDLAEKVVALGTSKIARARYDDDEYLRGSNLIDTPRDQEIDHGCGSAGVMVGGQPGLSSHVGIAPGADLIMASQRETGGQELALSDYCIEHGARVVLHEYAPWVGYHLDGSSPMEQFIDRSSVAGVAHINPAGNLSGSQKLYKHAHPAGAETSIEVLAPADYPAGSFAYLGMTLLWRDPSRSLSAMLEDPTGHSMVMPTTDDWAYEDWHDGLLIWTQRATSSRGTVLLDMWVFAPEENGPPVPSGSWFVRLTDPTPAGSPDLEVIAYVHDDLSGWAKGIHFPEHSSEDHLIGYPGTADHGIAVAAYTGHGYWGATVGQRAEYSGRGRRIDGEAILDIAAPDDPITAGYREGSEARYHIYGGTSGASPHVAGAAALLLQADSSRNGIDVADALQRGALSDDAVGAVPNEDFGFGKLRIYQSIFGEPAPTGRAPFIESIHVPVLVGQPTHVAVPLGDVDTPLSSLTVEIDRDYDGSYDEALEVDEASSAILLAVDTTELGTQIAKLQVTDDTGRRSQALAVVDVVAELPTESVLELGGGCACRTGRATGDLTLLPTGIVGLAWLLARRRRRRWIPTIPA